MSLLNEAYAEESGPLICTIVGQPGTGKTSLASTFPNPFMIRTQGENIPKDAPNRPKSIGVTESSEKLWEQLKALLHDPHPYQTLIIDSVTGSESMFISEVLASDPKARGIQTALGGYGAGRDAVAAMHMRLRKAVELLRTHRGMNTVFVAHADVSRIDPPDSEGFNQYTLRLNSKSMAPYVDNVDLVGFLKQATILRGDGESKKAITTGEIVLVTQMEPAYITKNRLGIKEPLVVVPGVNPLEPYLPKVNKSKTEQVEKKEVAA